MKTAILIYRSDSTDYQDTDILSIVEKAGDTTLLVDGPVAATGSSSSSAEILRLSLRSILRQTTFDEKDKAAERPKGDSQTIWVLDTRDLPWGDVEAAVERLRILIFYLAEPPRALVLETYVDAHVKLADEVRKAFGFTRQRERNLMRSANHGRWLAVALRVFGIRGSQKARRLLEALRRIAS